MPLFSDFFSKFRLITVSLLVSSLFLYSQNPEANQSKYWNYRERLVNDFMVVGPAQGQSIPAGVRNLFKGGALHFGDAPVYLAYYIAVLSTEYRLLSDHRQKSDRTLTELYYALEALNRLDVKAESLWGKPNLHEEKNGFLIESDVPSDFCQRYAAALNQGSGSDFLRTGSGIAGPCNQVLGGMDSLHPVNSTCSQDHLSCLLMGLALASHCTGDSLTFRNELTHAMQTYSFVNSSKTIAGRILHYMKDSPFGGRSWKLYMPDKKKIAQADGGNAGFNAYGFALAGTYITGKNYTNRKTHLTRFYWKSIYAFPALSRVNTDNLLFGLELAAIGDSWHGHSLKSRTPGRIQKSGNYGASALFHLWAENHFGWDIFYYSMYAVLHDSDQALDLKRMETILDSAPKQGPYYHNGADKAASGWAASSMRFYDTPPHQLSGKDDFPGNYNGLDYMLFYNLYRLCSEKSNIQHTPPALPYQMLPDFPRHTPK